MITILAVSREVKSLSPAFARHPSVEVLVAADAEEALETLARNRRIDAVLLLDRASAAATARQIREEDPGAPALYAPASTGPIPRVASLADDAPEAMVEALHRRLEAKR